MQPNRSHKPVRRHIVIDVASEKRGTDHHVKGFYLVFTYSGVDKQISVCRQLDAPGPVHLPDSMVGHLPQGADFEPKPLTIDNRVDLVGSRG
jgi:hypothetical protein